MSIRQKLMAGYLSVALFTVAAGLFGVYGTKSMLNLLEGGDKHFRSIVESATDLNVFAKNASDDVLLYLALRNPADRERFFTECASLNREIAKIDGKVHLPQAKQHLETIGEAAARFELLGRALITHHDEATQTSARFRPEDHREMAAAFYEEGTTVKREAVALARFETDFLNRQEAIAGATELSSYARRASGHLLLYLTLHDRGDKEKFLDRCAALKRQLTALSKRKSAPDGERILGQIEREADEIEQVGRTLIELHDRNVSSGGQFIAAGQAELLTRLHELAGSLQLKGRTLAKLNVDREMNKKAHAVESAAAVRRHIVLVMAGAVFFALVIGYVVTKNISSPITALTLAAQEIGSGKRDVQIDVRSTDEIGLLADSFNRMAEDLRHTTVSRDYLNSIFSSMAESLIVTSTEGIIQHTNQAALNLLGCTEEELRDKPLDICFSPESDVGRLIQDLKEHGSLRPSERMFVSKDGKKIPVSLSSSAISARDMRTGGFVWVALDITDRKRAEEALQTSEARYKSLYSMVRLMCDTVPDLIWAKDLDRKFLFVNKAMCEKLLCARDTDEPIGKTDMFFADRERSAHPDDPNWHNFGEICVNSDQVVLAARKPDRFDEFGTVKGEFLYLDVYKAPFWDEQGEMIGTVGSARVVTAEKRLEEERKRAEEALRESEQRVKAKLDSILMPEVDIGALELADIIDTQAIQSIMDSLFQLTNMGFAILDLHGKVLVSTGWEDICAQFHRVHEETSKHCLVSDTVLSRDVQPNTFKIYKCKNNMWDMATPIMIGEKRMGHLFMGQFFFEHEQPDCEAFRSQARQYGFDEEEYLAALDRVPRRTWETINTAMTFNIQFAQMVSTLSHSNIKLARTLTERTRAQEALKESEEWYRSIVEESFDGIFVQKGPEIIFANSRLYEMLGYSAGELEHMDHWLIYHPDYQEIVRKRAEARMRGEIVSHEYEVILQRKDGSHFDGEVNARAVTVEGEPGVRVWVRDVSTRRRLEEVQRRLATAIEQSADAIAITDARGNVEYVNSAYERITGYTQEEVIGPTQALLKEVGLERELERKFSDSITTGTAWSGRTVGRRKDGTLYDTDVTISPVRDPSGGIVNFVVSERDVTQEVQLQQQLLQAQKMEAIGTLAGGIAHDFNNLLTVIMGFSELLLGEKEQDHPEHADLQKIFHAAKNGAELVRRLLMFSRKTEQKPVPMNLNRQIVRVEKLLHRTIPRMIDIQLDLSPDLPEINADPSQIEQVLMNLALNARDAMPDTGKLTVRTDIATLEEEYCRLHVDVKPGEYVALEMSDTGHGMDKETLEHIFEPFFTTKEIGRGTGLGLAMVYGIVTQHNGHIAVYSEVGKGTTFRVYLPAIPADVEPEVEDSGIVLAGGTETVLLVDDEESVRELGARILTKFGYTVLQAENGREALDLFTRERSRISLVVLDLIMPEMGGMECFKALLVSCPRNKVAN